jgi:hypothetical protein
LQPYVKNAQLFFCADDPWRSYVSSGVQWGSAAAASAGYISYMFCNQWMAPPRRRGNAV